MQDLNRLNKWKWQPDSGQALEIEGISHSGIRTSFVLPQFDLCFDVGQGFPLSIQQKNFFITHGHMDHAAGIPYVISQRALYNVAPANFYMPEPMLDPMFEIMNQWSKIENHQYQVQFHPVRDSFQVDLHAHATVKAFRTTHRIPSYGYCLMTKKMKLKHQFENFSQSDLDHLRREGQILSEQRLEEVMAFTGDTQIEVFSNHPWLLEVPVLIVECTYLDNARDVNHARKWGHTHLDEILEILPQSKNKKILLTHLSPRYPLAVAKKILAQKVPKQYQDLIEIFPF